MIYNIIKRILITNTNTPTHRHHDDDILVHILRTYLTVEEHRARNPNCGRGGKFFILLI